MQTPVKQKNVLKLFGFLPIWSSKKRDGKTTYYLLGIPFWKRRQIEKSNLIKYYLFNIPILRKYRQIVTEADVLFAQQRKFTDQLQHHTEMLKQSKEKLLNLKEAQQTFRTKLQNHSDTQQQFAASLQQLDGLQQQFATSQQQLAASLQKLGDAQQQSDEALQRYAAMQTQINNSLQLFKEKQQQLDDALQKYSQQQKHLQEQTEIQQKQLQTQILNHAEIQQKTDKKTQGKISSMQLQIHELTEKTDLHKTMIEELYDVNLNNCQS